VWSGGLCAVFSMRSWLSIKKVQDILGSNRVASVQNVEIEASKNRLLKMSVLASTCLIINLICTLMTSAHICEWARTSDIWLHCSLFESWGRRNFNVYGLVNDQTICTKEETSFQYGAALCQSGCKFVTADNKYAAHLGSSFVAAMCATAEVPETFDDYTYCDCPCQFWVEVKKPSAAILGLSYFAQAMVTCIVGITLGLRYGRIGYALSRFLLFLILFSSPHTPFARKSYTDEWIKRMGYYSLTMSKSKERQEKVPPDISFKIGDL
jgi:hypothetical protein